MDSNRKISIVNSDHTDDYFTELCALASTGTLTPAEWQQLEVHLSHCADCQARKAEYDKVIATTIPAMVADKIEAGDGDPPGAWSLEEAERALFERINLENIEPDRTDSAAGASSRFRWPLITGVAAAVLLFPCVYVAYQVGMAHGHIPSVATHPSERSPSSIEPVTSPKLPPASDGQGGERTDPEIAARVKQLEIRLRKDATETAALQKERHSLLETLSQRDAVMKEKATQQTDLEQRLSLAQANIQDLQLKLNAAAASQPDKPTTDALQQRVVDLTGELKEKDRQIAQNTELLEHDRDIRNLMGARDLYIGEIYDVAKSGKTQKPFGRVFYTRGKSLIFYAYDLDQQPGVKLASTFQAWGRKGVDQQHDVSLGIFYQDDQNRKRWVLKSDDSAMLSQLDAVFVTVEPHGASTKPTGRPLLFTYLKLPPNHP